MTAHLDVTLTPAQWEHYDRHGWTLVAAPTIPSPVTMRAKPNDIPVPATVPCPGGWDLLQGPSNSPKRVHHDLSGKPCPTCSGSGVVPRTVGVVRPEVVTLDPKSPLYPLGSLPAGRVGTATVTPVPVVDVGDAPPDVPHVVVSGVTGTVWWCGGKRVESGRGSTVWTDVQQVQVLFATPPNPGTTVWRLDRNEER